MPGSYCFIINPFSNRGKTGAFYREKVSELSDTFDKAEFIFINKEDSISELSANKAASHGIIVAVGGDGTVKQVAQGILGTEAILGVLPMGSGNDFAKSIGLTSVYRRNVEILIREKVTRVDAVTISGEIFLNTFGIGVDGLTNLFASQSNVSSGFMRYFISGLKALLKSEIFEYECSFNGKIVKGRSWMMAAANGEIEGGKYRISPGSDNTDGKFELVIVTDISRLRLFYEFIKLSAGINFNPSVVLKYTGLQNLHISVSSPEYAHSDGEVVQPQKSFQFELKKSAIPVIRA